MDDQNEPANVVVGYVNCIESETGYEEFNHNRTQESAYMAIGTTDNNGTNRHQSNPHGNSTKMDKFEKALVQLATTLKILKLISAILVIAVVVVSVTFGILIYKMMGRINDPEHPSVNGGWSSWTSWSSCSSTCGPGLSQRQRNCSNPIPALNGRDCSGDSTDKRLCETRTCAVNGGWSSWASWSSCSSTCGPGLSQRQRYCTNPPQASSGRSCIGDYTDKRLCEIKTCQCVMSAFTVYDAEPGATSGTIKFTYAAINIGGHYNTSSGIFTCEYPGIYVFHLHILKDHRHSWAHCFIRKNGVDMIMAEANANSDTADIYLGSSNTVILHLAPGDVADVGACSNIYSLNTSWQTSFSGFLLRAD